LNKYRKQVVAKVIVNEANFQITVTKQRQCKKRQMIVKGQSKTEEVGKTEVKNNKTNDFQMESLQLCLAVKQHV